MLRRVLDLLYESNGIPLSVDTISRQLGVSKDVADQLVHTLVQRGRLVEVDEGCTGCAACPLKVVCAGAPSVSVRGYALAEPAGIPYRRQDSSPPRISSTPVATERARPSPPA